jgi:hypothetical protein
MSRTAARPAPVTGGSAAPYTTSAMVPARNPAARYTLRGSATTRPALSSRAKRHPARGTTVRGARGPSRTVSTAVGSSGSAAG